MIAVQDYLALPFVEGGRDRHGVDCWGLVCLIYRDAFGIELDTLDDVALRQGHAMTVRAVLEAARRHVVAWRRVAMEALREGDLLVLHVSGRPMHVGVVIDTVRGRLVHAISSEAGVLVERYASPTFGYRIEMALRHPRREVAHG